MDLFIAFKIIVQSSVSPLHSSSLFSIIYNMLYSCRLFTISATPNHYYSISSYYTWILLPCIVLAPSLIQSLKVLAIKYRTGSIHTHLHLHYMAALNTGPKGIPGSCSFMASIKWLSKLSNLEWSCFYGISVCHFLSHWPHLIGVSSTIPPKFYICQGGIMPESPLPNWKFSTQPRGISKFVGFPFRGIPLFHHHLNPYLVIMGKAGKPVPKLL